MAASAAAVPIGRSGRVTDPEPVGTRGLSTRARPARGLRLGVANALGSLVTLGAYSFWGRARVRRWLWASTRLLGEPFEYTGTGGELFRGAALATLVVLLPLYAIQLGAQLGLGLPALGQAVTGAAVAYLVAVGRYRALRYRLSRTAYRGVRGGLVGGGWGYGLESLGRSLLLVPTLGLTLPWMDVALARRRYRDMRLGDRPVGFEAEARPLFAGWLRCWLLLLPTLGLSFFWYVAARERAFAAGLGWEGLRLRLDATGGGFARLAGSNGLLLLAALLLAGVGAAAATAGLVGLGMLPDPLAAGAAPGATEAARDASLVAGVAFVLVGAILAGALASALGPVLAARRWRFTCRHLAVAGEVDWDRVAQAQLPRGRSGEGLATLLAADGL